MASAPTKVPGWTYYGSFLECPRLGYFKYRLRIVPAVTPPALRMGIMVHAGLEASRTGKDYMAAVRAAGRQIDSDGRVSRYPNDERAAINLVAAYSNYWGRLTRTNRLKFLAVEHPVTVEFKHDGVVIPYYTRLDAIVRWFNPTDAGVWLDEVKTTSEIRGDPTYTYVADGQIRGEFIAWQRAREEARAHGGRVPVAVHGVLMEFLSKDIRAPGEKRFVRQPMPPPNPSRVSGWLAALAYAKETADRVRDIPESRMFDVPERPQACVSRWGRCAYFNLCHQGRTFLADFVPKDQAARRVA